MASEKLTPQKTAEDIAQVFLGQRIQCSQCHNHPFDRWTLDDYYGFSAFFAGVTLKRGVEGREVLAHEFEIEHTTIQFESLVCRPGDVFCVQPDGHPHLDDAHDRMTRRAAG